jgi:hypothetical protein
MIGPADDGGEPMPPHRAGDFRRSVVLIGLIWVACLVALAVLLLVVR